MNKYYLNFQKIKKAEIELLQKTEKERNYFLENLSKILLLEKGRIIKANRKDVSIAKKRGLSSSFIERLVLDESDIKKIVIKLQEIKKLESGIGRIIEERMQEDGLKLRKVAVPLGVIAVIYEARPEVTIDVAALCVKSGNAAILKGGSEAHGTNKTLYRCIVSALDKSNLSKRTVSFISTREKVDSLLKQNDYVDLVIARGGYELVRAVMNKSTIPVLAHAVGGARIYVDKSANLSMAQQIIINAKVSKSSACNSLDTIVVHRQIASKFIPKIIRELKASNVEAVGDKFACKLADIAKASENDWGKEFLSLKVAIKVVRDINEAVEFINKHGKRHSEGIISADKKNTDYFTGCIDAAAIFVNCSTRFHDGYVFGFGSEVGIATGKLHARGPVGLKELTTYKWEVYGSGQVRE